MGTCSFRDRGRGGRAWQRMACTPHMAAVAVSTPNSCCCLPRASPGLQQAADRHCSFEGPARLRQAAVAEMAKAQAAP